METRFMRLLLFFDLPVLTAKQRRAYGKFRKVLIDSGYIMKQESVYSKLAINRHSVELELNKLKLNKPKEGLVQVLVVTEKQFASIVTLVGDNKDQGKLETTDRLIII